MSDVWPALNACLNAGSAVFLVVGRLRIARKEVAAHRSAMNGAVACSVIFLASYVAYHCWLTYVTRSPMTKYPDVGALRTVYLTILLTHTVLAGSLVWFVPRTHFLARHGRYAEHRRIARWTFPIWLYVSVTGVVVYLMLYVFPPAAAPA